MGRLYLRNGVYYADYYDRAGVRQRPSTRTRDPKVARQRLRDFELATTDRGAHQTEAVADALDYFTDVTCAGRSPATVRCYKQKACHITRLMGDELLDHLTRENVERFIAARLSEGAHTHSVHKELVVLRGALKSAKARDRFHSSMDIVPEFDSGYVPRKTYLTAEQFLSLVPHLVGPAAPGATAKTIEKRERIMKERALYCMLIAFASPRRGELEALEWQHVDIARGVLILPKGKTVGRPIAIHPMLRPWLEGFGDLAGWRGRVVEPWSNVGRDLPAACIRAGVPRCTPNDLRRTFASWLVQSGVSLLVVSRLLGHSSTRMVEMVYGQLDDATLAAAISRLPGCDAGVSQGSTREAHAGTTGHSPATLSIVNSVEDSLSSTEAVVPRDGVEPPTRGFSGLADLAPKPRKRAKLGLVG
ncbi:MAG: tyrosine-type recombinase/integrase [Hyphomicrobiaceae bacterium]